jgi:hypothetical protein
MDVRQVVRGVREHHRHDVEPVEDDGRAVEVARLAGRREEGRPDVNRQRRVHVGIRGEKERESLRQLLLELPVDAPERRDRGAQRVEDLAEALVRRDRDDLLVELAVRCERFLLEETHTLRAGLPLRRLPERPEGRHEVGDVGLGGRGPGGRRAPRSRRVGRRPFR